MGHLQSRPLSVVLVNVGTDSPFKQGLRKQYNYPPYGLLSIASMLRAHGYKVHLIDLLTEAVSKEAFLERLCPPGEDVVAVGIPTYTESFHLAIEISRIVKAALPSTHVVLGGVHVSFCPEEGLEHPSVDFVVRGEGEAAMVALLESIRTGGALPLEKVPGLGWRGPDGIHLSAPRALIHDLDCLPLPAFDLTAGVPAYSSTASIISSRGCPGACVFCASRAFSGSEYRLHSAEWLFSLLYHYRARVREFSIINFMDDTFTADEPRLRRLHAIIQGNGWRHVWACKSRVDTLNDEVIRILSEAGCRSIHLGIESGDQKVLDKIGKRLDLKRALDVVGKLNARQIRVEASFMIGLPQDTRETIDKTLMLATLLNERKLGLCVIGIATPFPGTAMYKNAAKWRMDFRTRDWRNYTTNKPIFSTPHFTVDDVRRAFHAFNCKERLFDRAPLLSSADLTAYRDEMLAWAESQSATRTGLPSEPLDQHVA